MPPLLDPADLRGKLLIIPDRDRLPELAMIPDLTQFVLGPKLRFGAHLHQPLQYRLLIRHSRSHSLLNGLIDIGFERSGQKGFDLHIHAGKPTRKSSIDNDPGPHPEIPQNQTKLRSDIRKSGPIPPITPSNPPITPRPVNSIKFAGATPFFGLSLLFFPNSPYLCSPNIINYVSSCENSRAAVQGPERPDLVRSPDRRQRR